MKTFTIAASDFTTISSDASAANVTLGKSLINIGTRKILAMRDWLFFRGVREYTSAASTQSYPLPDNCWRVYGVKAYDSSCYYYPKEIRDRRLWVNLNRTSVSGNIPQYYFVDEIAKKFEVWPVPTSTAVTYYLYFGKKFVDMTSSNDYTTGTVSVAVNGVAVTGVTGVFTAAMVGRYLLLNDFRNEIVGYTSATAITVANQVAVAVSGASTDIAECIPLPDGFEDMPLWFALWNYYLTREKDKLAKNYKEMFEVGVADLIGRDAKSTSNVFESQDDIGIVNPNFDPRSLEIT